MRILSANKFYYIKGGSERYFFEFNQLLQDNGHQVIPFSMTHPKNNKCSYSQYFVTNLDFSLSSGVKKKIHSALNVIFSIEAKKKLDRLLIKTQPDIAHLQNIAHQLSPSILYSLYDYGIPIIHTLHDFKLICPSYTMYTHEKVCERCLHGKYYNAALYRCNKGSFTASIINMIEMYLHNTVLHSYDKVSAFISPSAFLRNKMIEKGLNPKKIHHIPNFIRIDEYIPHYENDGYLFYFGQLISVKGLDTLLQAMKAFPKVSLIIAGQGDEKIRFEAFAQQNNLNVSFVGFQSGKKLQRLIQNSLAVIVPSVWYENMPYTIVEAFAYGKPVITSRFGGMAELIDDGETGFLFEPGNHLDLEEKISIVLDHSTELSEMGRTARKKAEREFNPLLHIERITELYQHLV